MAGQISRLTEVVGRLRDAGIPTSAFIDPEPDQIEAAAVCRFDTCEVHTGRYAAVFERCGRSREPADVAQEIENVRKAGVLITQAGMNFNAGHALNYANVGPIAALPKVRELHIGHSIVSRSVFQGFRQAVAEMKRLIREAQATGRTSEVTHDP